MTISPTGMSDRELYLYEAKAATNQHGLEPHETSRLFAEIRRLKEDLQASRADALRLMGLLKEANEKLAIEAELARIDALTDEEILQEARDRGVNVEAEAKRVRDMLLETCRKTRESIDRLVGDPKRYRG